MEFAIKNKGVIIFYLVILVSSLVYVKLCPSCDIENKTAKYVYEYNK